MPSPRSSTRKGAPRPARPKPAPEKHARVRPGLLQRTLTRSQARTAPALRSSFHHRRLRAGTSEHPPPLASTVSVRERVPPAPASAASRFSSLQAPAHLSPNSTTSLNPLTQLAVAPALFARRKHPTPLLALLPQAPRHALPSAPPTGAPLPPSPSPCAPVGASHARRRQRSYSSHCRQFPQAPPLIVRPASTASICPRALTLPQEHIFLLPPPLRHAHTSAATPLRITPPPPPALALSHHTSAHRHISSHAIAHYTAAATSIGTQPPRSSPVSSPNALPRTCRRPRVASSQRLRPVRALLRRSHAAASRLAVASPASGASTRSPFPRPLPQHP